MASIGTAPAMVATALPVPDPAGQIHQEQRHDPEEMMRREGQLTTLLYQCRWMQNKQIHAISLVLSLLFLLPG